MNNTNQKLTKFDALRILGLSGRVNLDVIKDAYREMMKRFHPDLNPSGLEMSKLINMAFDVLKDLEEFVTVNPETGEFREYTINEKDYSDKLANALNFLKTVNLTVEICGAWLWVTGNTRAYKDQLKANGFFWANTKQAWYYRPKDFKSSGRGKFSLDQIRQSYGSKTLKEAKEQEELAFA